MAMRETEVGCFVRFYKRVIKQLNLRNPDGTGFDVAISPAYPFITPNGVVDSSGYQTPGNETIKITPPEITIHTYRRNLPIRYQTNFIGNLYGEKGTPDEGKKIGQVYSQEIDLTLQLTLWAEDPRQREFLKMQIEKPYINRKRMSQELFEIGIKNGWDYGFIVQNLVLIHRGDVDIQGNSQFGMAPRLYSGSYEITFTTELRDISRTWGDTVFDVDKLVETGLDPSNYNISDMDSVKLLVKDLMRYYGINISLIDSTGKDKSLSQFITEAAIAYGNKMDIYVDSYLFMESLSKICIGSVDNIQLNIENNGQKVVDT